MYTDLVLKSVLTYWFLVTITWHIVIETHSAGWPQESWLHYCTDSRKESNGFRWTSKCCKRGNSLTKSCPTAMYYRQCYKKYCKHGNGLFTSSPCDHNTELLSSLPLWVHIVQHPPIQFSSLFLLLKRQTSLQILSQMQAHNLKYSTQQTFS